MSESSENKPPVAGDELARKVGQNETRKLKARERRPGSVLVGFGLFGLVGWSIALPTLLGAALGAWIDREHPSQYSWTLMLMILGLMLGSLNAWHWVRREHREIEREQGRKRDE